MSHFTIITGEPGGGKSKKIVEMLRQADGPAVLLDGDHSPSQIRQLSWENHVQIRHVTNRAQILADIDEFVQAGQTVHVFIDVPFLSADDYLTLHERACPQMPITVTMQVDRSKPVDELFQNWPHESFNVLPL